MAENAIVGGITRHARGRGAYVTKTHGGAAGRNGIADLLICYHGWFVAVEVKQPGGRISRLQQHELGLVEAAGGWAIVAYSVQDVRLLLDQLDQAKAAA